MEKQFTTPVSMKVTEEQFNADLRQPLEKLGYRTFMTFDAPHLCNNFNGTDGLCKMTHFFKDHNRHFIDHYNPKLFLALASLTTESTETKEEVLARFEKGIEEKKEHFLGGLAETVSKAEVIWFRFKRQEYLDIMITMYLDYWQGVKISGEKNADFNSSSHMYNKLIGLNLLEAFCEPVYKEIETISISEAEKELKGFGREVKIDKDLK